jgi:hypothetical protein
MKQPVILVFFVLMAFAGFSQPDEGQPDSILRVNKVMTMLSRYTDYGYANCIFTSYDRNGKPYKSTMLDKKGTKKWIETIFEYDNSNRLAKTIFCSYMNNDPLSGREMPDSILDSSKVNILNHVYDRSGRLVKTTGTIGPVKTPSETSYYYTPDISVWKFHRGGDSLLTVQITTYERPSVSSSVFSSYDSGVVTKNSWQEAYENVFDESGKLVKRLIKTPGDSSYSRVLFYEYDRNGLLVKRYSRNRGSDEVHDVRLYEYAYWDRNVPESLVLPFLTKPLIGKRKTSSADFKCVLTSDKTVYKVGELPRFTVGIANNGKTDVYFVGSLDGSDHKWRFPYCYYSIKSPEKLRRLGRCGNMNPITEDDFRLVKAGEEFNPFADGFFGNFTANDVENFKTPGVYELEFHYSTNYEDLFEFMGSMSSKNDRSGLTRIDSLLKQVPRVELTSNKIVIRVVN